MRTVTVVALLVALLQSTPVAAAPASQPAAAPAPRGKSIKDFIKSAKKAGGFTMDGYFLWCPSVIKVGDTYHMFASRWPAEGGIGKWTTLSECVRATSKNLLGPYEFAEVVLQKRPDSWDNTRVHNGKVVATPDGKFVLYHIDTANETGYAFADKVEGPWTRLDKPVMKISNPAPLIKPDGSVYVFGRLGVGDKDARVNRGIAFTAPRFDGAYALIEEGRNLLENDAELEDPTIWWANEQYNVIVNDWKGKATGTAKAGAQYFSKDGKSFKLMSPEPVFTKTVAFDDGTSETFQRRERPFVFTDEKDAVIALFTTGMPKENGARIIAQPVDRYVPDNK
jgi:hypothetical protein